MCEVVDRQRREPKDGGMEAGRHRRLRWSKRTKVRLRALQISSHFRRDRKAQKLATLNTVAAATEPAATTCIGLCTWYRQGPKQTYVVGPTPNKPYAPPGPRTFQSWMVVGRQNPSVEGTFITIEMFVAVMNTTWSSIKTSAKEPGDF